LIRTITQSDFDAWNNMYKAYIDGNQATRDKLWAWLVNTSHEVEGLVATDETGLIVGFVHYRPFLVPHIAETGGFIDDLFVMPNARGNNVAKALVEAVVEIGKQHNWKGIRWITDEANTSAIKAYDKFATRTTWVTYDIAPL